MRKTLGSLDSDQIPIRIQFEPVNCQYLEGLMSVSWDGQNNSKSASELDDDELALTLMLKYFVLISGGSTDVRELESAFVNRTRDSEINPGVGDIFSGITLLEMVNRANRTYRNAKRLPGLLRKSSGYEQGQGPLAKFSDDEIAELSFVAHTSVSDGMSSGLQMGEYFKLFASEYFNRNNTAS